MAADEDRWRDGITSAVAALQAGERHSAEDRELIRADLRATERRLREKSDEDRRSVLKAIDDVDRHCKQRFEEAADAFRADQTSKRGVTVAWIGGAFLLVASIVNSIAAFTGSGP